MPDTGFVIASAGVNDTGKGTIGWTNPDRVTADDGSDATAGVGSSESNWLRSSHDFQGLLPISAVITGVTCRVQVSGSASRLERVIEIQLHNATEFIGTAKTPNTTIPDSDTDLDFGGADDDWDATLNIIQIGFCNNLFHFGFRVDGDGIGGSVNCDATWMKIHFQVDGDVPGDNPDLWAGGGDDVIKNKGDFV